MSVTQTVDIPASHRLTIDVPREVPVGRTVLTFTPAVDQRSPDRRSETAADEHIHTHPCPICAAHLDPVTGNPRYNAETIAAIEEGIAISNGEIPVKWYTSTDEMWEDLMKDDPDDPDD